MTKSTGSNFPKSWPLNQLLLAPPKLNLAAPLYPVSITVTLFQITIYLSGMDRWSYDKETVPVLEPTFTELSE